MVANFKQQKLEQAHCFSTKQFCINNKKFSTSNIGNTSNIDVDTDINTNKKRTWFRNKSANKLKSSLKCSGNFKEERDLAFKESKTK